MRQHSKCRKSNQRLLGELFDASMLAADLAINGNAVDYSTFGRRQQPFCPYASNDIPHLGGASCRLPEAALILIL